MTRIVGKGCHVREEQAAYSIDFNSDSDFGPEERKSHQEGFTGRLFLTLWAKKENRS